MLCVAFRPGDLERLVPKLVTTLAGYTREQFLADLSAGIIVGIVALPLAIAFAIASGVSPERGLFTAIVAGFLISALGGSRVQIGGPTGAFVVIVYAIVQRHGVEGLAMATLMAGVILVGFGLARLGGAIKFIPYPVTIGFTSGIALIIFSGEVKDFLGLRMGTVPPEFVEKWRAFGGHLATMNPWAVSVSVLTLAIIVAWPRFNRRIPSPFVALIVLFFGRWAGLIPMATLAGILVVVAYSMSEWRTFINEFRAPKSDVAVLLTTFLLTVFWDLTVAIEVGMVLAAFLFMRRMAEVTNISALTHEFQDPVNDFETDPNAVRRRVVPAGVEVYEITGPFFFGAAETFKDRLGRIAVRPKVLILRMRHVPAIDSTGLHALRDLVHRSRHDGSLVILSDVHAQPVVALERSGMYDELGEENIHGNIDDALNRAREHLGLPDVPRPTFATPTVAREK